MTDGAQEVAAPLVSRDIAPQESLSEAVVAALAEALDAQPTPDCAEEGDDVLEPLYSVVDPELLDALFEPDGARGRATFIYQGHEVVVHSEDRVTVDPAELSSLSASN